MNMERKTQYRLKDLPEFQRFTQLNPGKEIGAKQTVLTYCGAIHWLSLLEFLNPDFKPEKYYSIEVAYLFTNDPNEKEYPEELKKQMQELIAKYWEKRLIELYPEGNWTMEVDNDPELTIEVYVKPTKE